MRVADGSADETGITTDQCTGEQRVVVLIREDAQRKSKPGAPERAEVDGGRGSVRDVLLR
jgi:hypothetical protein